MLTSNNLCAKPQNLHADRVEKVSPGKTGNKTIRREMVLFMECVCICCIHLMWEGQRITVYYCFPWLGAHRVASSYHFSTTLTQESCQEQKGEYEGTAHAQPLSTWELKVVSRQSSKDYYNLTAVSEGLETPLHTSLKMPSPTHFPVTASKGSLFFFFFFLMEICC